MAYDASNNKNNEQQVASAAPLSQGQPTAAPQSQGDSSQSAPTAPLSQESTQPQGQNKSAGSGKASSGMFTNIQKYVSANKPQAKKMAGAVTKDVGKQASQISQQAEKKENQLKQQIEANQGVMDKEKQFAQQQVDNIMNQSAQPAATQQAAQPQEQAQAPQVDPNTERFQRAMEGDINVQNIQDMNLAQESAKSQALSNTAKKASGEQGRRELLKQTFGDRAYGQGAASLDDLIVSGDAGARTDLIKGTQKTASDLQSALGNIKQRAGEQLKGHERDVTGFGSEVEGMATGGQDQIYGDVDSQIQALKDQYGFGGGEGDLAALQQQASDEFGQNQQFKSSDDFWKALSGNKDISWDKGGDRDSLSKWSIDRLAGLTDESLIDLGNRRKRGFGTESYDTGKKDRTRADGSTIQSRRDMTDEQLADFDKYLTIDQNYANVMNKQFDDMLKNASDYGIDTNKYKQQFADASTQDTMQKIYGWDGHQSGNTTMNRYDVGKINEAMSGLFSDMEAAKSNSLGSLIENKYKDYGISADDFASGNFLDRAGVADQSQLDKVTALQNLMGRQNNDLVASPDAKVGRDTELLKKLSDRYKGMS